MLHFAAVRFDEEIAILSPEDAFEQLAGVFCAEYPPEAHRHPHPEHAKVIAETNRASDKIKSALDAGDLAAFAFLPDKCEFFRIPPEYWKATTSYLLGRIFAFPAERLVPRQFEDARILIRSDDWLSWLVKTGVPLPSQPGVPVPVSIARLVQPDDFDPNAPAEDKPWWSTLEALGWVSTRSSAYVVHLGNLETERTEEVQGAIAFAAWVVYVSRSNCLCGAKRLPSQLRWKHCCCTGDAGRALLTSIRLDKVTAVDRTRSPVRKLEFFEFAGIGQLPTCADWIDMKAKPVFSSAEIMAAFPPQLDAEPLAVASTKSTANGERECKDWLLSAFDDDKQRMRTKMSFQVEALQRFKGRLTLRGFLRVWGAVAPDAGRTTSGRKS